MKIILPGGFIEYYELEDAPQSRQMKSRKERESKEEESKRHGSPRNEIILSPEGR